MGIQTQTKPEKIYTEPRPKFKKYLNVVILYIIKHKSLEPSKFDMCNFF